MENVKQAYYVVGLNFQVGDRLFLFGFSRGAYTARSLAGLIGLCGVPNPEKGDVREAVDSALNVYRMRHQSEDGRRRREDAAREHAEKFSYLQDNGRAFNEVHFVGVWDTVGALGVPVGILRWIGRNKHGFHDVSLGSHIRHAYHALAIDERRKPFKPTLWRIENEVEGQKVEQVWFPGVHSNVGGGYVDRGLSDRAFLWMCSKARDAGMGFDQEYMDNRVDPNLYGELRDSMKWYYKLLGDPKNREIGGGDTAGEGIHESAKLRFMFATETPYRRSSAKDNLGRALEGGTLPIIPFSENEDHHNREHNRDWNDGRGTPQSLLHDDDSALNQSKGFGNFLLYAAVLAASLSAAFYFGIGY